MFLFSVVKRLLLYNRSTITSCMDLPPPLPVEAVLSERFSKRIAWEGWFRSEESLHCLLNTTRIQNTGSTQTKKSPNEAVTPYTYTVRLIRKHLHTYACERPTLLPSHKTNNLADISTHPCTHIYTQCIIIYLDPLSRLLELSACTHGTINLILIFCDLWKQWSGG